MVLYRDSETGEYFYDEDLFRDRSDDQRMRMLAIVLIALVIVLSAIVRIS